jgi:hypothetical protein
MQKMDIGILALTGLLTLGSWAGQSVIANGSALAAESLNVEELPSDPAAYHTKVEQIVEQVDGVIDKLKAKREAEPVVLDLLQTRDNVVREVEKIKSHPEGSLWTNEEVRGNVDAMLKLLKVQYDKAAEMTG